MAWWWRRLAGKLLQRGRGGDGVPRVAQGCTEAIGGVEVDGGEAEPPGLLAGGDCGGGDLTGRAFPGVSGSGKARRSVASCGEEDDDHGGVLRLHERRRGVAVLVQTPASSRRGELCCFAAKKIRERYQVMRKEHSENMEALSGHGS